MRTSKWLAFSVILFILLRVFVRSASLPTHNTDYDRHEGGNHSNEKALSRSKRFSTNEYLMIAISVFNIFVLLYNNIETFFPQRNSLSKTVAVASNSVDLNQATADSGYYESRLAVPLSLQTDQAASQNSPAASLSLSSQASAQRDETIDQIAEMLIRYISLTSYASQTQTLSMFLGERFPRSRFLRISGGRWCRISTRRCRSRDQC